VRCVAAASRPAEASGRRRRPYHRPCAPCAVQSAFSVARMSTTTPQPRTAAARVEGRPCDAAVAYSATGVGGDIQQQSAFISLVTPEFGTLVVTD
jgi:hypothetical protein